MRTPDAELEVRRRRVRWLSGQGFSVPQIADRLGVCERTVTRDRRILGCVPPAPTPLSEADIDRIRCLLEDGCSIAEAARTVGRSIRAVKYHFPDATGWTRRECGELGMALRWCKPMHDRKRGVFYK